MRNELLGTASVNLSNVLKNNGGKSMYGAGVCWRDSSVGVGKDEGGGISLRWRINLVDPFPPGQGRSSSAPCAWDPWSSKKAEGCPLPLLRDSALLVQGPSCWDAVTFPS